MTTVPRPAEGDVVAWFSRWGPEAEEAARPWLEEFDALLHAEAGAIIGQANHPLVEEFIARHMKLLKRAESDCIQQAMMVNGPLRQVLSKYYQAMGARESGLVRMSRVLPLCIAELVPDLPDQVVVDILRANAWGYEALRIQDDFLDEPDRVEPEYILLCGLFYRWCTEIYCQYTKDLSLFFADYQIYHDAMMNAVLVERRQAWEYTPFRRDDLMRGGERAGLVKLCASTLFRLRGEQRLVPVFERYIDLHLAARQLLDDMQDFRSDAEERRLSAPISMVWAALAQAGVSPTPSMLFRGLALLDVVPRSLELVRDLTAEGMDCLKAFPDSMLYKLLDARASQVEVSLTNINQFQVRMREALGL